MAEGSTQRYTRYGKPTRPSRFPRTRLLTFNRTHNLGRLWVTDPKADFVREFTQFRKRDGEGDDKKGAENGAETVEGGEGQAEEKQGEGYSRGSLDEARSENVQTQGLRSLGTSSSGAPPESCHATLSIIEEFMERVQSFVAIFTEAKLYAFILSVSTIATTIGLTCRRRSVDHQFLYNCAVFHKLYGAYNFSRRPAQRTTTIRSVAVIYVRVRTRTGTTFKPTLLTLGDA